MKHRRAHLLLFVSVGLLLATARNAGAQQPGESATGEFGVAHVSGNVMSPQAIILKEPTTVTQAINLAGGVAPQGITSRVRIMRGCDPSMQVIVVDLTAIKKGRAKDIIIQPYDIVFVPGMRVHVGPPICRGFIPAASETLRRIIH
jgi:SLBB domain